MCGDIEARCNRSSWLTLGAKVYAQVFSHPFDQHMPSQVALAGITAERRVACGAPGAIEPFPAPARRVLFEDHPG